MNLQRTLALALDPSLILRARGLTPDSWQRDLLLSSERQILLNCCRQAGKSTVVSALALHTALFTPGALVLLLSPSQRQSGEIFRKVLEADDALGRPIPARHRSQLRLELANGSRVLCLPGREETIRSFGGVNLIVLDEAARTTDSLYYSVRPMLAVSRGRLIALSTPFGQRGWFWQEWERGQGFHKIRITWRDCPRISEEFIAGERASMGDAWVGQEYNCEFGSLEGLVYPDFDACLTADFPHNLAGKPVGGIDFGWRNPFAALWGVLDRDDVLWIGAERYLRQTPLHEHARALREQRSVVWYADPSGATEINELLAAGLKVLPADNDIRLGIAAVSARIRTGRLRVWAAHCPNLRPEARLYRYPTAAERAVLGETPVDDHNHALGALRYLVASLDAHFIARLRNGSARERPVTEESAEAAPGHKPETRRGGRSHLWEDGDHWKRI